MYIYIYIGFTLNPPYAQHKGARRKTYIYSIYKYIYIYSSVEAGGSEGGGG